MKIFKAVLAVSLGLGLVGLMFASATATQTVTMSVNAIGVLAVTGNPSTLSVSAPTVGGDTPSNPSSNTTYAQYTSTVGSTGTRKITAAWGGTDAAPAGCSLKLAAAPAGGTNQGSTAGQITLSSTAQDLITAIKSCATGTAATNGAQLTYVLSVNSVTSLVART
jgi:hypothetical protein